MAIYSGFTHWKWWFIVDLSIEMVIYGRLVIEAYGDSYKNIGGLPIFCHKSPFNVI